MPAALPKELKLTVQTLYLQGFTPSVITAKTGVKTKTVKTWATNEGWSQSVDRLARKAADETRSVAAVSSRVRSNLAKRLEYATDSLPDKGLSMGRELQLQERLEPLVRNAKTVFGWNESSTPSAVNVNVQGDSLIQVATNPVVKQSEQT